MKLTIMAGALGWAGERQAAVPAGSRSVAGWRRRGSAGLPRRHTRCDAVMASPAAYEGPCRAPRKPAHRVSCCAVGWRRGRAQGGRGSADRSDRWRRRDRTGRGTLPPPRRAAGGGSERNDRIGAGRGDPGRGEGWLPPEVTAPTKVVVGRTASRSSTRVQGAGPVVTEGP